MSWLDAVGIPYLALTVLAIMEGRGHATTWSERFIELGIDACILGIGVCGATFANETVQKSLGVKGGTWAVVLLLVCFGITGLCLHMRDFTGFSEAGRARTSIFLGLAVLAINSEIVVRM